MTKLAIEFGLSDVAMHKICRKYRVPTPPVGYWAKKAHGKRVTTTPLPDPDDATEITIRESSASGEPEAVAEARVAATAAVSAPEQGNSAADPVLERTLSKLSKIKPKRDGLVHCDCAGLVHVAVRQQSVERAGAVLSELVAAAARVDVKLIKQDGGAAWLCHGETISFELVEVTDQVLHVATQHELQAVAKWKLDREQTHRRYGYWQDWGEPRIPKWDHRFQGGWR